MDRRLPGAVLANEAKLQLMDIYRSTRWDRVEELTVDVLRQTSGQGDMAYSVYLGAIERIGPCCQGAATADLRGTAPNRIAP